jgi:hypothetical protein
LAGSTKERVEESKTSSPARLHDYNRVEEEGEAKDELADRTEDEAEEANG